MNDFEYLIAHENEHTYLDFKAIQYIKDKHEDFLKDLIAIANASGNQDRHIILGVNYKNNGERDILGIEAEDFIDSAQYQQLAYENIEPKIDFDYFPYNFKGDKLGILKIFDCNDKPYMMKKDYAGLNKGDSFIRRGDSQDRLTRSDIDKIVETKSQKYDFSNDVNFSFEKEKVVKKNRLPHTPNIKFPSVKAREEAEQILKRKKQKKRKIKKKGKNNPKFYTPFNGLRSLESISKLSVASYPFGNKPLEKYSIKELEEYLEIIEEEYIQDDNYELYENQSNKLNFAVLNNAEKYIEDASIRIEFKNNKNLIIPERIPKDPSSKQYLYLGTSNNMHYPNVETSKDNIIVTQKLEDIKHHIPTEVFVEPLRILFNSELAGKIIEFDIKLYAKNLARPLTDSLAIEIISPDNKN